MKISDAIRHLAEIEKEHGDLEIVGGFMSDDAPLRGISVVDEFGVSLADGGDNQRVAGIFLEG